jgi:IS30 family transposase
MLRLARDGASARDIALALGVARSTIQDNLKRAAASGLSWRHHASFQFYGEGFEDDRNR